MRPANKFLSALNTPIRVALACLVVSEAMTIGLMLLFRLPLSWQVFTIAAICGFIISFAVSHIIFRFQRIAEVQKQALQVITNELQEAKNELEMRVEARTKSLEQANLQIRDALEEKNVLLKEIHHRVKNNLQIVSSLLSLQARGISDQKVIDQLNEAQNRIQSMVLIHERLYLTENLARIDYDAYVHDLVGALNRTYSGDTQQVKIDIEIDNIVFDIDTAVPCGLIITELVTNAYKHAFSKQDDALISIMMSAIGEDNLFLTVKDNGIGLPEDFDPQANSNIGLQIVDSLVKQLKGAIIFDHQEGTEVRIRFPVR